ncbi:hypothetical protein [Rhizobium sp. 21-4511-3d]
MTPNSVHQMISPGPSLPRGQVKEELDRILDSLDFRSTTRVLWAYACRRSLSAATYAPAALACLESSVKADPDNVAYDGASSAVDQRRKPSGGT